MNSIKRSIHMVITIAAGICLVMTPPAIFASQNKSDGSAVIPKSEADLRASATHSPEPIYPPLAKAAHVVGSVVVQVTIDESGKVIAAKAISGHPLLKDSAVSAALQWQFTPATQSGVQVKVAGSITFTFQARPDSGPDSVEAMEKSVREHPDSAEARYKLARAYDREMRQADAIRVLKEALKIDPALPGAYATLGQYLMRSELNDQALDPLKQALRLDPHNQTLHLDLALAYTKLQRIEEAIEPCKEAIKDDPSAPGPYSALAAVYSMAGRFEEAVEPFKEAIKRQSEADPVPGLYNDYINLATVYSKLGRTAEQIDALKHAIALGPRIPDGYVELGMAYVKLGDKKSAMEQYNALNRLDRELARSLKQQIDTLQSR